MSIAGRNSALFKNAGGGGEWIVDFRRSLSLDEAEQWVNLVDLIHQVQLNDMPDKVKWNFEKSGAYTTQSMYRFLLHRGVVNMRMEKVWKSKMPLKIKIFMWLTNHKRIQAGKVLGGMKWKGETKCVVCGVIESVDHILFKCPLANMTWTGLREALGWDRQPGNLEDFLSHWLPIGSSNYVLKLISLAAVLWSLWTTRNKMVMEGEFLRNPADIIFKILVCLQKWRIRLRPTDQDNQDKWTTVVKAWGDSFREKLRNPPRMENLM
jgi:hypothetical protein